ncbi:MAG: hypothetical protein OES93_12510 [Gammaproteobacteria bacterium]|nr:hypothetical protein [Gammaproteobacteria bacterium]
MTALVEEFVDAPGTGHVRKAERENPKCILDEFLLGATQSRQPVFSVLEFDIANLAIEQFEERIQTVFVPRKLELRLTQFV